MFSIVEQQVIEAIRAHVVNQSRYQWSTRYLNEHNLTCDDMQEAADEIDDEQTIEILGHNNPAIDNKVLLQLAGEITVEVVFDEDGWVDRVADYIVNNEQHFTTLWDHIRTLIK